MNTRIETRDLHLQQRHAGVLFNRMVARRPTPVSETASLGVHPGMGQVHNAVAGLGLVQLVVGGLGQRGNRETVVRSGIWAGPLFSRYSVSTVDRG